MRFCFHVALISLAFSLGALGQSPPPLVITTQGSQKASVGKKFSLPLRAEGGTAPYSWRISNGKLPPGLKLDISQHCICGSPITAGEFRFIIAVNDSSTPPLHAQREFTLSISSGPPLQIDWKQFPQVQNGGISGSVVVSNTTDEPFDLTVIILAVNESGKAFALGYQHFTLQGGTFEQAIPFSSTLPGGSYMVHADAVAEVANTNSIYRARKQTAAPLSVPQM